MSYSDDDGLNWSRPKDLTPNFIQPHMKFLGLGPGAGIALRTGEKKGRLVVPGYVANYTSFLGGSQSAFVFYSDDQGDTWHMGKTFNDDRRLADGTILHSKDMNNPGEQGTEATVVQLNNGDLKMFMRGLKGKVRVATSKNGGESWENTVEIMEDVPDVYVQLSAVHLERDGKEYIVIANANGPGRTNGHVRLAEVQADGALKWINHRLVEEGKFAYNSLQYLDEDQFGLLYENASGNQNDYTGYYKKFNWKFLTLPEPKLPENPLLKVQVDKNNYAILTFEKPILSTASPSLLLSNGNTIPFVTQVSDRQIVYKVTDADKGAAIIDVASGDLSNINGFKTVLGQFISDTDTRKVTRLDSKSLKVTAEDVWQGGHGPDNLLDGDKNSLTELLWDVESNRVDGKLPDRIHLPQTITFTQRTNDPFNLHTLTISKRTPGNGTLTKYQVKGYLGDKLVHDSKERAVPFTDAEITYSFGDGIRVDRLEFIPLEAQSNPTTVANQMLTLREIALYAVDTLREVYTEEVTEKIPFGEERVEDARLAKGEEVIQSEGKDGSVIKLYNIVLINGVVSGSTLVGEKEGSRIEPVAKVIRVGSKVEEEKPVESTQPTPLNDANMPQPSKENEPKIDIQISPEIKPSIDSEHERKPVNKTTELKLADSMEKPIDMSASSTKVVSAQRVLAPTSKEKMKSEKELPNTAGGETGLLLAIGLVGLLATAKLRKNRQ